MRSKTHVKASNKGSGKRFSSAVDHPSTPRDAVVDMRRRTYSKSAPHIWLTCSGHLFMQCLKRLRNEAQLGSGSAAYLRKAGIQ
eukprot:6212840-Karenia_brevis.AAC.1